MQPAATMNLQKNGAQVREDKLRRDKQLRRKYSPRSGRSDVVHAVDLPFTPTIVDNRIGQRAGGDGDTRSRR